MFAFTVVELQAVFKNHYLTQNDMQGKNKETVSS